MNRMFIYPYNQYSESATAVARALDCQKLLRVGSRYQAKEGDVIVNWGASDCPFPNALNAKLGAVIDKREFFKRTKGCGSVPEYAIFGRGENRRDLARNYIAAGDLKFPLLCRTKVKGHDGEGIVIAEDVDELVDAPLYVNLKPKTAEYRVHVGRKDGEVEILGVQQKFLPQAKNDKDMRLRTTANGCYFVWSVGGEPVVLPPQATIAVLDVFEKFPELTFGGFDVIYDKPTNEAYVIEINSAPELTEKAAKMYAEFFEGFRQPKLFEPLPQIGAFPPEPHGPQQLDYAGEHLPVGMLRDPIDDEADAKAVAAMDAVIEAEREIDDQFLNAPIDDRWYIYLGDKADEPEEQVIEVAPEPVYYESDKDFVLCNIEKAVRLLEAAGAKRRLLNG